VAGVLKILTFWRLRRVVPKLNVLPFTMGGKKRINETGRSQGCFQEVLRCPHINCCGISWPFVSYSISFFSYIDSRKNRRGSSWPRASRSRRYPNEVLLWLVIQSKYRSSNTKLPVRVLITNVPSNNLVCSIMQLQSGTVQFELTEFFWIFSINSCWQNLIRPTLIGTSVPPPSHPHTFAPEDNTSSSFWNVVFLDMRW